MFTYRNYLENFSCNDFNNHRQELSQQLEKFEVTNDREIELNLRRSTEELIKPFIFDIHVTLLCARPDNIHFHTKWKQNGITIAGVNESGNKLNQFFIHQHENVEDNDQSIYMNFFNDYIMDWKCDANNKPIVAGGNGQGNPYYPP